MTAADVFDVPVPDPAFFAAVFAPYPVLVPYSKMTVVAWPFGTTLPFSVALVSPIPDADFVVTEGATDATNVLSAPWLVPASLVATRR